MTLRKTCAVLALLVAGGGFGFGLKTVLAEGIPSPNPLYYSGMLTEGGAPVNGSRLLTINVWLGGTPQLGEKTACPSTSVTTPLVNGHFRIALDASCAAGIHTNPNLYVEVVAGTTSFGRSPIGAVPFAVEADHAVNATNAMNVVDGGSLATAISTLQQQVHPASAFRAVLTTASATPNNQIVFDQVAFDLGNEYDASTGVFRPTWDGVYLITCAAWFTADTNGDWTVSIHNNGTEVTGTDAHSSVAFGISSQTSAVTRLSAGDKVTCADFSSTKGSINSALPERNAFSAVRLN